MARRRTNRFITTFGCLLMVILAVWTTVDAWLQLKAIPEESVASVQEQIEAAASGGDVDAIKRLLFHHEVGAYEKWLVLKNASAANHRDVVLLAVSLGADIDYTEPDTGLTALHYAVIFGSVETVRALLELGCNPHRRTRSGVTPIDIARTRASNPHLKDFQKRLLECEAILEATVESSDSPLSAQKDIAIQPLPKPSAKQ